MQHYQSPCTDHLSLLIHHTMQSSLFFIAFLIAFASPSSIMCSSEIQTYIVHVRRSADDINADDLESWYRSFLPPTTSATNSQHSDRLVYSYTQVFSGFAARLTAEELKQMAKKQGFVRAYPNKIIPLLTTHTPDFLGLAGPTGVWNISNLGRDVIVGVLDTGILPGHPSFADDGVPPVPARWKGRCDEKNTCNNKVIGARGFISVGSSGDSPKDDVGHGSHTASTIAGNFVKNVNAFGLGKGTTAGMAPHAHLAIYKVCNDFCSAVDILAGLDAAVSDRVDVLSLSLGGESSPYDNDPIAIGTFAAIQKGIAVVCAGGNSGPAEGTLSNEAPWILTVAASSIDRQFRSTVKLGDGTEYNGETLYQPANFSSKPFPLVSPKGDCFDLDDSVKGKIVLCEPGRSDPIAQSEAIKAAGGVGILALNQEPEGYTILVKDLKLPGSILSYADGEKIKAYLASAKTLATASITFNGTVLGVSPAPVVTFFSSRGPNQQSPGILKPDISAPGLNIIAAWHTKVDTQPAEAPFNIISGTSMATPHVSGVVALVKSLHPDWSPAAIKSAIITSSDSVDRDGNRILDEHHNNASFFVSGAGHVNPSKAAEPGLIYDLTAEDYIAYLCGVVGDGGVSVIAHASNISCSDIKQIKDWELNYPTITLPSSSGAVTVNRTVTNVGDAAAKFTVEVDVPKSVTVTVKPETLQFSRVNEKQTFTVSVTASGAAEGNLKWVSNKTVVRSALVITA